MITMTRHRICNHAKVRRKQMGVTEDRIWQTIAEPDAVYPGSLDRTLYQRGDLVVVVSNINGDVVTILWHGKEGR